eukprot:TRINITY_DN86042_c0_g1_i1.p1 TRINITY_DN86042_c0_g1~~TRINITY_DN86042_c0_g1_i1.p1  ORF type:complete len:142 (+),score=43.56 TRINITY_DN86042_c0_g1_i1:138-563(+)
MVLGAKLLATAFDEKGMELREYYAAACGHCQALAPAWKQAQATYTGPVTFRQIECNDESWKPVPENADLCKDIEGFPTIKLFKNGEEVSDYDGERNAESLVNFAKQSEKLAVQCMPAALSLLPARESCSSTRSMAKMADFL